jgi:hypothetical protein
MIRGMNYPKTLLVAPLSLWFSLSLSAVGNAQSGFGLQSTPTVRVLVYSFSGLSPTVLQEAETEALRLLHPASLQLEWIDCTGRVLPASCLSAQMPTDLVLRVLAKALPQASASTLGIAGSSAEYATAFLFYDRVLALRTPTRLLGVMLGRVMAHEIVHLLVPEEEHAHLGLMRGQWSADDLQISSTACSGLLARLVQCLNRAALRRISTAQYALQR